MPDYLCPPGFDCAVESSCPAFVIDCPQGFFCSSYDGFEHESRLDYQYAKWKMYFASESASVSMSNADAFAEPGRYISVNCLPGFSCASSSSMRICGSGEWCPGSALEPIPCDHLSYCPEYSSFEINFVMPIISVVLSALIFFISWRLTCSQKAAESRTRREARTLSSTAPSLSIPPVNSLQSFNIYFHDVSLPTPNGTALLLNAVSGRIDSGSLYAVMGPTGCGKSSLISVLRSGGFRGHVSGKIHIINNETKAALQANDISKCVGFVPQQDIVDRSLTVRELLTMHAMLRTGATRKDALARARQVMSDLHIWNIGDTVIGGSETTPGNISGGELKRVNIACELVSIGRPAVLFLDEPTAGLDANIANELIRLLKNISLAGVLVVLSVQQPRPEIFQQFTRVLLMVSGGGAFEGPPEHTVPYLASMGYEPTEDASDADFCIDVLNNIVHPSGESECCLCAADLVEKWRTRSDICSSQQILVPLEIGPDAAELGTLSTAFSSTSMHPGYMLNTNSVICENFMPSTSYLLCWKSLDTRHFLNQLTISFERQLLTSLRNRINLYVYFGLQLLGASFLSIAFTPYIQEGGYLSIYQMSASSELISFIPPAVLSETRNNADIGGFRQMMFFLPAIIGAITSLCAVPLFSGKVPMLKRESQTGVSSVAAGLGFMAFDLCIVLWMAINYNAAWQLFGHAGHYYHWFLVITFTSFAASGIGYLTGVLVSPMSANTVAVVSSIIFAVFSGVEPSLRQISKLNVVSIPWYLSYATWTAEGTYYTWTQYLSSAGIDNENRIEMGAGHYGYDVSSINRAIGCLAALGLGFRILALIILRQKCLN